MIRWEGRQHPLCPFRHQHPHVSPQAPWQDVSVTSPKMAIKGTSALEVLPRRGCGYKPHVDELPASLRGERGLERSYSEGVAAVRRSSNSSDHSLRSQPDGDRRTTPTALLRESPTPASERTRPLSPRSRSLDPPISPRAKTPRTPPCWRHRQVHCAFRGTAWGPDRDSLFPA